MQTFKITKNGKDLVTGLTKEQAIEKLFTTVEDFSNGYIYDNEAETIYHEVDGKVVSVKGDESVRAGDNYFEIEEEGEKMRKILHLENKTTNEHRYYGSLVALCRANESIIPKAFYHTLKRLKFETPYETETYIIRLGSLQTTSDVEAGKNNG